MGGFPKNLIDPWSLSKWGGGGGGGGGGAAEPVLKIRQAGGSLKNTFSLPCRA